MERTTLNHYSKIILESSLEVHRTMGPGLLESIYELCLIEELCSRGILALRQVEIPLTYKQKQLSKTFVADIVVENEIILEIKAMEKILPVHEAQVISYLKLSNKRLGFLINFNVPLIKQGFRRFVNGF